MAPPLLTKPQQCIQVYYTICDSHMDIHNIVVLKQNTYLVLLRSAKKFSSPSPLPRHPKIHGKRGLVSLWLSESISHHNPFFLIFCINSENEEGQN